MAHLWERNALSDASTGCRHRGGRTYYDEEERRAAFAPEDPDELMAMKFAEKQPPMATDEDYWNEDE